MRKWFETSPKPWLVPDVKLSDLRNFEKEWKFSDGILTIEHGDMLKHPQFGFAQVVELETDRIRIHPYYGPDAGYFPRSEVIAWRDQTWKAWDDAGVKPIDMAKAMFPENWK